MSAILLDGKGLALAQRAKLRDKIAQLQTAPGLAVIMVGDNPASQVYVRHKRKGCEDVGIASFHFDLPVMTGQQDVLDLIEDLNQDERINGILVQLPLPDHIDANAILDHIQPDKDVDGFHAYNLGRLTQRRPRLRPSTPRGIITLLEHYNVDLRGMTAVVVGASNIVGRPMALELLLAGSTVTVCHRFTRDLEKHINAAELVIVAIGKPGLIATSWLSEHAIVVDVGMTRNENGSLSGDIDFATAKDKVNMITPVPGGVGPMTVLSLLENTYFAATELQK